MSTPNMRGYNGETPAAEAEVLDTTDSSSFNIGVVAPGGSITNYNCCWYNLGYANLYDAQLKLVAHPTLDQGLDTETIDKMNIGAPFTGNWLHHTVIATPSNTAGWTYPMQNPFRPFIDKFFGGIKWDPPSWATPGLIRKAFQWDGSYFPDTWDYIFAPLGNGYKPHNANVDYPWTWNNVGTSSLNVNADVLHPTGFKLTYWNEISHSSFAYDEYQNLAGNPWFDNVDNATGYCISMLWEPKDIYGGQNIGILVEDGVRKFIVWSRLNSGVQQIGVPNTWHSGADTVWYSIPAGIREVDIFVKGNDLLIDVDETNVLSATLNVAASGGKRLCWGALNVAWGSTPGGWGHGDFGYLKFYCGGDSKPIY